VIDEYRTIYDEKIDRYVNPREQKIKQLEREYKLIQKGDVNFTPPSVAEKMLQYARIDHNSKVLEPSCGIGNIADKIKTITEHVDVCEFSFQFVELLELKGYNVVSQDFLQYNKQGYYDAIIMNPPFSKNQDITHLQHAYKLLQNNGTLVCITSPHWQFANDKASQDFREWIEDKTHFVKELASGTFEMTGVASRIVVIEKNEEVLEEAI
jgi:type I restriction-modification system DNA methylase subunit